MAIFSMSQVTLNRKNSDKTLSVGKATDEMWTPKLDIC